MQQQLMGVVDPDRLDPLKMRSSARELRAAAVQVGELQCAEEAAFAVEVNHRYSAVRIYVYTRPSIFIGFKVISVALIPDC